MPDDKKPFFQRKTTWAALLSGLTAVVGAKAGQIEVGTAAQMIAQSLLALTLRSAIANK
jgi:hypothetical protein